MSGNTNKKTSHDGHDGYDGILGYRPHARGGRISVAVSYPSFRSVVLLWTSGTALVMKPPPFNLNAADLSGHPRVNGDIIIIAGKHVRFYGIYGPAPNQTCAEDKGVRWYCGDAATHVMKELIGPELVSCDKRGWKGRFELPEYRGRENRERRS
jgi:hypothetical protein